ncbi:MAG: cyclic nucleotide-binding domain-containing protein, partial [Arenicellales bacterium]
PQCPGALVNALGDDDRSVREAVARSLGTFGADALDATMKALDDPKLEAGAILSLAHLPAESQADIIRDHAGERIKQALSYHDLWQRLQGWAREDDAAQLLADSVKHVAERYGIRALRLLGTLADREAFDAAIASLGSSDQGQGANAVELLDSVSDRQMVRPLLRLWEPGIDSARVDHVGPLRESLRDDDPWLRACAALAARGVNDEEIASALTALSHDDPDETVRDAASNALNGDKPMQKLDTLSVMERILFLKRVPLFADLAPTELKQVASITYERLFHDGEVLAEQGEPGDELYIIVSGEVRVLFKSGDEHAVELARRSKPGECVGEMAIISRLPRAATLIAAGDVRTLCIGQKQFEVILRERPETSLAVMRVLCERLQERGSGKRVTPSSQSV